MSLLSISGFVVPATPPLETAVAPNYERFDGLEEFPSMVPTALGTSYGPTGRPGQLNTESPITRGIEGLVGSVGAAPYPVDNALKKSTGFATERVSVLTTQFNRGPGGANPGYAATALMSDLAANPPQVDQMSSIFTSF